MPFLLLFFLFLPSFFPLSLSQLSPSFYSTSCPNALSTISNTFKELSQKDNVVAPSTLRLILHDCFVQGCDGSILLSSTPDNKAERDAPENQNLPQNAFNAVNEGKKAVEALCPGVVSCADILAVMARDAVVFLGGPTWDVPLGRLDGRISEASAVEGRLPGANFDAKQLADMFSSVGLSLEEMVILSGAHTVGFSHCDAFKNRLYNFNSSVKLDPSIDPSFATQLQEKCPLSGADNLQPFDVVTPFVFDNNYYKDLQAGKGVLFSDQVLFQDASTQATVTKLAASQEQFFEGFKAAMVKMTSIGVKMQAGEGEVRSDCTVVNKGGGAKPAPLPSTPTNPPPLPSAPPVSVTPSPPPVSLIPPPSPPPVSLIPPPSTLPPPVVLPPPANALPPPVVLPPPAAGLPPPVPSPGIVIPGIPGFLPPITIPVPGVGSNPPPGQGSQSKSSPTSSSPASSAQQNSSMTSRKGL